MTTPPRRPQNVAVSIRDLLLRLAKQEQQDFNLILNLFYRERLLVRLANSAYRDRFVLKGGALLFALAQQGHRELARPTKDLDFRAGGIPNTPAQLLTIFKEICQMTTSSDGVVFDVEAMTAEEITEGAEYHGVRLHLPVTLAEARSRIQIDIGFGDVLTTGPLEMTYPVLLDDLDVPHLLAYAPETIVAEKYEAMLKLSLANSRMKDFYDLYQLAHAYTFRADTLGAAIQRTCEHRGTALTNDPLILQPAFETDEARQRQWAAFLRRGQLHAAPAQFADTMASLRTFLSAIHRACYDKVTFNGAWMPGEQRWRMIEGEKTDGFQG